MIKTIKLFDELAILKNSSFKPDTIKSGNGLLKSPGMLPLYAIQWSPEILLDNKDALCIIDLILIEGKG
jgi:hypothetical protein